MTRDMPSALVLSLSGTGLAVARALSMHGVKIYGTDWSKLSIGRFSKLINKPPFGWQVNLDNQFLENLIEFSQKQKSKPVLFPSDDKFIEFVSRNYKILKDYFIMQKSLAPEISKKFLDKKEFYKLCDQKGIAYPKTLFLTGEESENQIAEKFRFPLILKPYLIHKWRKKLRGKKVILIKNRQELKKTLEKHRQDIQDMMCQEVIVGPESNIYIFKGYFNGQGKPLCWFTGRKIRQYPPNFGSGSLVESIPQEEIAQVSLKFLSSLGVHGLGGTELKYDPRDDQYKMIEVNMRPQLWDDLMRVSEINLIWIAYCDMIGLNLSAQSNQKYGVKWTYITRDILSAVWHISKRNIVLSEWIKSYKGVCVDALIDFRDIKLTFLGIPTYTIYQFFQYYT